jgi:hypothetical protein
MRRSRDVLWLLLIVAFIATIQWKASEKTHRSPATPVARQSPTPPRITSCTPAVVYESRYDLHIHVRGQKGQFLFFTTPDDQPRFKFLAVLAPKGNFEAGQRQEGELPGG